MVGVLVRLVVQGIIVLLFLLVFSPRDVELRNIRVRGHGIVYILVEDFGIIEGLVIERGTAGGVAAVFEVISAATVSAVIEGVVVVLLAVNFAPAIAMVLLGRAARVVRV